MGQRGLIVAGTGHRPHKLGGYGSRVFSRLVTCAEHSLASLLGVDRIITGMALGWDQALAEAAINLRIPFDAYLPFRGQDNQWPAISRAKYRRYLLWADQVHVSSDGDYTPRAMQARNEQMVDDSTFVLALWNGSDGGTANCIRYAERKGTPIENCWDYWQKLTQADWAQSSVVGGSVES